MHHVNNFPPQLIDDDNSIESFNCHKITLCSSSEAKSNCNDRLLEVNDDYDINKISDDYEHPSTKVDENVYLKAQNYHPQLVGNNCDNIEIKDFNGEQSGSVVKSCDSTITTSYGDYQELGDKYNSLQLTRNESDRNSYDVLEIKNQTTLTVMHHIKINK